MQKWAKHQQTDILPTFGHVTVSTQHPSGSCICVVMPAYCRWPIFATILDRKASTPRVVRHGDTDRCHPVCVRRNRNRGAGYTPCHLILTRAAHAADMAAAPGLAAGRARQIRGTWRRRGLQASTGCPRPSQTGPNYDPAGIPSATGGSRPYRMRQCAMRRPDDSYAHTRHHIRAIAHVSKAPSPPPAVLVPSTQYLLT